MPVRTIVLVATFLSGLAHADFRYTQSGQFTNGVSEAKAAFGTQATQVAIYVKGEFLRIDLPDGLYGIIDLDGRRDIQVDPKTRTYSIVTFDEIRARDKAAAQQFPSHVTQDLNLTVTSTGKTRSLLGQTAQETAVEIEHDPAVSLRIDSWIAPSVDGFNEVKSFYERVTSAISRTPDGSGTDAARFPALQGVAELMMAVEVRVNSLAVWPAVMSKGILDLCKVANAPVGLPLLQTYQESMTRPAPPEAEKGLANRGDANTLANSGPAGAVPVDAGAQSEKGARQEVGMEFTLRVTSFSADKLDKGLFEIPLGYKESHLDLRDMWISGIGQ